ncbi:alpha/beta fold hydrolase [Schaalia canis]|uniref:Alpha/beta fold hydrolase n=1 Tax=Schaalia canis TaxID=100469 RepID=A0A3P1SC01_9ACTO|nr:alpha/beta fold hydrolase [Schaalia canis]RRC94678.1 alpha/beta fold hydrolase [Schaalia canis]
MTPQRLPLAVHQYGLPEGIAPPILLVHGLTEAGTTWPDAVEHWGRRFHIIAPDLRGHGESPRFMPEELSHCPEIMRDDLLDIIRTSTEPVIIVAHSMGANLVLSIASEHPQLVRALVLEDPAKPMFDAPLEDFAQETLAFVESMNSVTQRQMAVARMKRETSWSQAEIDAWAECKPLVDRGYLRGGLGLLPCYTEDTYQALSVPTLLILPEPAPMAPQRQAVTNPLVRWAIVEKAGHCVRRDQPEAYYCAVEDFLADVLT